MLANISIEVILGMLFLFFNNIDVKFAKLEKLTWRLYIEAKALSTTCLLKHIDKREFTRVALDENSKTFVIRVTTLEATTIYPSYIAQIAAV